MSDNYSPTVHMEELVYSVSMLTQYHQSLVELCERRMLYLSDGSISYFQAVEEKIMHENYVQTLEMTLQIYDNIILQVEEQTKDDKSDKE